MKRQAALSLQTKRNWLIDMALFIGGILAGLSGIFFLFVPIGGFQGGKNPLYGARILMSRELWDDLHAWAGVAMILAAVLHISIHWTWVVMMAKRVWHTVRAKGSNMSRGAKINVAIDALIAVGFLLTAVSGIYFLFVPSGGFQGGANMGWDPGFLFSRTTWDLIHTWSGVAMIVAAVVHFAIHWRWVMKVTVKFFRSMAPVGRGSNADNSAPMRRPSARQAVGIGERMMIRKAVLCVLLVGFSGVLIYGAVLRSTSRMELTQLDSQDGRMAQQQGGGNAQDDLVVQGRSGEGRGAGTVRGEGQNQGTSQSLAEEQVHDWFDQVGSVEAIDSDAIAIRNAEGVQLIVEGRAWVYIQEAGMQIAERDEVTLTGFYEDGEFKPSRIVNLTTGESLMIRDENGRPMWAGGRGKGL